MKNESFSKRIGFALRGARHGLRNERSLRLQLVALIAVILLLLILRPGAVWTALVLMSSGAVLAAELFNTALEALADHVQPQQHLAIEVVKDCAAAAVLITSLAAVAVAAALAVHILGS
jgi:diacylglycerol kinase (ATP)